MSSSVASLNQRFSISDISISELTLTGSYSGLVTVEMTPNLHGLDKTDVHFSLSNCPGGSSPIQGTHPFGDGSAPHLLGPYAHQEERAPFLFLSSASPRSCTHHAATVKGRLGRTLVFLGSHEPDPKCKSSATK